jgi:SAM-dependent methyltransferase
LSENMLVQGLENLTSEIKESVEAIQSGMQSFRLPERVDLIFNMGNSFLMLKDEKKEDTLSHVVDALRDDGEFVLEIYNPNEWRKKPEDHFLHLRTIDDEESDTHVTLSYTQSINEEESYNKIIWYREEVKKQSREVLKDVFPIKFHFLEFDDAKAMIEKFFLLRKYMEVSRTTISIQMNRKG